MRIATTRARRPGRSTTSAAALLAIALGSAPIGAEGGSDAEGLTLFESKIRPVLIEQCYSCHSVEEGTAKGGLQLDTRDALLRGGDGGPAVEPGDPDLSLLIEAIRYDTHVQMPPSGKLESGVIAAFEEWVRMGAPDPRVPVDAEAAEVAPMDAPAIDWESARSSWAFSTPTRQEPPAVSDPTWVRSRVDAFVLARLDAAGLSPNPEADRRALARRLSFDLTGLPPEPASVEAFVVDGGPDAVGRFVDGLLASPHFGERWARAWLDLSRYAEDQAHIVGDDASLCYPNAYRYRDWVIRAFNDDLPFDAFVREQLAADLIDPDDEEGLAALGFVGLGPKYYRRNSPEVMADEWEDRVDVVSRGLLGLTVACARCHDHKFDPIPTEDYYALAGVFASTVMFNRPLDDDAETKKSGEAEEPEEAIHILKDAEPTDLNIFIRGNVDQKGPVARRHFLAVLSDRVDEPVPLGDDSSSGRRDLAEAIADPENPLTARVFVNRVWGQLFGRPIVGTTSNFGALGEPPTHPELLDDLAARFVSEGGWSLKWLVRELATSGTYRQSTDITDEHRSIDPANALLGRMSRKRLPVEAWRDAVLDASGALDRTVGGPSIDPSDPEAGRRTVYSAVSRLELHPMLARFDFPDPNTHSDGRARTTTPLQKLFVLNSPFVTRHAERLADRLAREAGDDPSSRIELAHRLLFSRPPSSTEEALALDFLDADAGDPSRAWATYAQALIASNEFLIID
ncbi:PSD1 and planctomycete cytochrome C domain-containing protein [Tautonia plasticadhaerens]|uniref:Planctomycete cytochrome C n=1 Tax=Tautonia plasticadhaerens TaxID=2527974 RepID=A0A518HCU8_9BACT|nr:PSD1 and planctomycete cytochrome C domain-containing protein [Tautonia plasticadhaerens]QDV38643.1 Planctomycete cytochrome C [Tautonia plasticadhaerens]